MSATFFVDIFIGSYRLRIGCAAALLVGLLISSWFTYLAGLAFAWTAKPLLWANLLFFLAVLALLTWPKWKHRIVKAAPDAAHSSQTAETYVPRAGGSGIADWLVIAGYVVLVSWMMFASFNSSGGKLKISNPEYSDFGPNTALMQSFAVGHNFPTDTRTSQATVSVTISSSTFRRETLNSSDSIRLGV